ncbi:MAG: fumarylacetoacetate hydrolase family protein [Deltaproteobacteria bacterium]|nr:fumarylacetoacetate hydrolase family protein [Deltaproteobacteria bacterium]
MEWLFDPPAPPSLAIAGRPERLPVRRIWCVGRNYRAHIQEMGGDPRRDTPIFFAKPGDSILQVASGTLGKLPYPPRTSDFHYETELVVAIGKYGRNIVPDAALEHVIGYAVGLDMTRRDAQRAAKAASGPWELAKAFDYSAVIGDVHLAAEVGHLRQGRLSLSVDGEPRQSADLDAMIWSVPLIVAHLSQWVAIAPGDLVYTGTPEGVGAVRPGQRLYASIDGLGSLAVEVVPP